MTELDRRVRRTRRTLTEALIALVLERGYERITVQDVLDRADVGRSTFYAHYRDKESLLVSCFDGMREDLEAQIGSVRPDPARLAAVVFQHAHQHRRVYQALCGRKGGDVVRGHLHRLLGEVLRQHLTPSPALPVEVAAEFYASAAVGLLLWWLDQGMPFGPDRLAAMYQELAGGPA